MNIPPRLKQSEVYAWLEILRYAGGNRLAATLLDRNLQTINLWRSGHAPTEWWWRLVFREASNYCLQHYEGLIAASGNKPSYLLDGYKAKLYGLKRMLDHMPAPPVSNKSSLYARVRNAEAKAKMYKTRLDRLKAAYHN